MVAAKQNSRHQVTYGGTPRVDLLPKRQRAELQHERTMPKLLLAIVCSAVLAGLIWAAGMLPGQFADQRLAAAEAESSRLVAELGELSEVSAAVDDLSVLSAARTRLAANEVLFASVHEEVTAAMPGGVALTRFSGVLAGMGAESVAEDAESAESGIDLGTLCIAESATVTVVATVGDEAQAAAFIDALADLTGFGCVVGTSFGFEDETRSLTVQIALGPDALAERFAGGDQ